MVEAGVRPPLEVGRGVRAEKACLARTRLPDAGSHDDPPDSGTSPADGGVTIPGPFASTCSLTGGAFACAQADDFDVSADGRLALLRRTTAAGNERLELECFDTARGLSTGRTVVTELPVGSLGTSHAGLMYNVRVASQSGAVLVTYLQRMDLQDPSNTQQYFARLFDASCAPVAEAFAYPSSPGTEYYYEAALTAAGKFALAWAERPPVGARRVHVAFYDASGDKTTQLVMNEGSEPCDYAVKVALNRATAGQRRRLRLLLVRVAHRRHELLYDDAAKGRLMRYSATGVLQGCYFVTGLAAGSTIRTGGSEQIYMRGSHRVVRMASVDFDRGCVAP